MSRIGYVEWYDAVERILSKEDYERLLYSQGQEYLAIKKTYGIIKELEYVILVITEDNSDGEREITIIPKAWVIDIK